jgi:hypothetical protein
MLVLGGATRLVLGSAWAYYSVFLPIYLALVASALLAAGFVIGMCASQRAPSSRRVFASLLVVILGQLAYLLQRDGYLLLAHARPREAAFGDEAPSAFFFTQGERVRGLTYIARQRADEDPEAARDALRLALDAATEVPTGNEHLVAAVATANVEAGLFDDAEHAIQQVADPYQRFRCVGSTAVELARAGASAHARRLFARLLQELRGGGASVDLVAGVHMVSRNQTAAGFHDEARETIERNVADADVRRQQLLFLAIDMARSGASAPAERLFLDLFRSVESLPSPEQRDWGTYEIAYYQASSGLDEHARRSAARIQSDERRREVLDYLGKPVSAR